MNLVDQPLMIDRSRLELVCDGDEDFAQELLQLLAADVTEHLPTLAQAITDRDHTALKQIAHYLKGATANVGITSMSGLALALEQVAHQEDFATAQELLASLQTQQQQLVAQVGS